MGFFVTICKSIGISDVLSLRTMAVAILYWKLLPNHNGWSTFLCMLTLGLLSSISHLLEYKLIGAELQDVQGRPIELLLPWLRKLCLLCLKEEQIKWLDFKWTFKLSEMTRENPSLDIVTNLDRTLTVLVANQCRNQCACCRDIRGKADESPNGTPYFKESDSNNGLARAKKKENDRNINGKTQCNHSDIDNVNTVNKQSHDHC